MMLTVKPQAVGVIATLTVLIGAASVTAQGRQPQSPSAIQGSALTYQGQLKSNGAPVNGAYNIAFRLYDAVSSRRNRRLGAEPATRLDRVEIKLARQKHRRAE